MVEKSANPIAVIDGIVNIENQLGDFIANGPSTGIQGHIRDEYRKRCDQYANVPAWAQSLSTAAGGGLGRICEPWYGQRGFDGPISAPPFQGGQCAGVGYNAQLQYTNDQGGTNTFDFDFLGGTLRGTFVDGPQFNGQYLVGIVRENPPGVNQRLLAGGVSSPDGGNPRIVNIVRQDGQPDNCGDPPPVLAPGPNPPPDPGPTSGPEPTDDPNNPTGLPLLPVLPYIDPIGGPTPIEGPDPFAPGDGGDPVPGNPDTAPGGGDDVGNPINVDPGPNGGGDGTDFGEPPAGRVWVGALLRFTFPTTLGTIPGSAPTQPVLPQVVGNVSLVIENGLCDAVRIRSSSMCVVRPVGAVRVTGVYVNVGPGITYTIRPLSLEKCPDNACASE